MAGHRRESGRPKQRVVRADRRRRQFATAMASAVTPSERVAVATNFLRSALATSPARRAEIAAGQAVQTLTGLAEALLDDYVIGAP